MQLSGLHGERSEAQATGNVRLRTGKQEISWLIAWLCRHADPVTNRNVVPSDDAREIERIDILYCA